MSELVVRTIFGKVNRLDMTDEQLTHFAFLGKKVYVIAATYEEILQVRRRVQDHVAATVGYDLVAKVVEKSTEALIRFKGRGGRRGGEIVFAKWNGHERGDWARGRTFYGGVGSAPDWIHLEP